MKNKYNNATGRISSENSKDNYEERKEFKDLKEYKENKDTNKEIKESKEIIDYKEIKDFQDIKDYKESKDSKKIKDYKNLMENKEENEKIVSRRKYNDKYLSSLRSKLDRQNNRIKSLQKNFYSKLDNFTRTNVLYQYNSMIYKPLSEKENDVNYKKGRFHSMREEPLSSIKIGSNVYYSSKNSLDSSIENKYSNRESMSCMSFL